MSTCQGKVVEVYENGSSWLVVRIARPGNADPGVRYLADPKLLDLEHLRSLAGKFVKFLVAGPDDGRSCELEWISALEKRG